jgi:NADPH2:quinone reductase
MIRLQLVSKNQARWIPVPDDDRIIKDFYPNDYLPRGVRLAAYGGDASDLPAHVMQEFLDAVAAGEATVPIVRVFGFDDIVAAHTTMESGDTKGKLVVTT